MGVEARIMRCVSPDSGHIESGGFSLADSEELECESDNVHATAWRRDGMKSTIFALTHPFDCSIMHRSGANVFGPHSATPLAAFEVPAGESMHVSVIALGAEWGVHERCPVTVSETRERSVVLTWSDQTVQEYCFSHGSWALVES
jgi:hypothetical protein